MHCLHLLVPPMALALAWLAASPAQAGDSVSATVGGYVHAQLPKPTAPLQAIAAPGLRVSEDIQQKALRSSELSPFRETAPLIREYARRYGFDWLLIMSQAYQESRFDQAARSSKGAVGVMQVLPSTAADRVVGIPDIYNLENNIHAGNKYLRFLHDQYVDTRAMSDLDKTLFALASYNAGPARVSNLRAEATGEGLDPNVWFDSVERIAARRIGRETVDYVGNIYSYWVAYGLNRERIERSVRAQSAALLPPGSDGPGSGPVLCSIGQGGAILCESVGVYRPVIRAAAVSAALSARIREQRRKR